MHCARPARGAIGNAASGERKGEAPVGEIVVRIVRSSAQGGRIAGSVEAEDLPLLRMDGKLDLAVPALARHRFPVPIARQVSAFVANG